MFAVTVLFEVRASHLQVFCDAIRQQASSSLADEPACRQFDICMSTESPNQVFLYELYDNREAFELHKNAPHSAEFATLSAEWVINRQLHTWDVVLPA